MQTLKEELSNEERLLALFSHLSIFFGSIVVPLIFWAIHKDKSRFVRFHSLQALFFHLTYLVLLLFIISFLVVAGIFGGLGLGLMTAGTTSSHEGLSVVLILFIFLFYGLIFLIVFSAMGCGIYWGIKSYNGALVRIPIIGRIIYKKVYGNV